MEYQDLSPKMQELLDGLKHASSTVDSDIRDALEGASDVEEFVQNATSCMESLAQEAYWWGKGILDVARGGEPLPGTMKPMFQIE